MLPEKIIPAVHADSRGDRPGPQTLKPAKEHGHFPRLVPASQTGSPPELGRPEDMGPMKHQILGEKKKNNLLQELNKNNIFMLKQPTLGKKQNSIPFQYKTQDFKSIPTGGG